MVGNEERRGHENTRTTRVDKAQLSTSTGGFFLLWPIYDLGCIDVCVVLINSKTHPVCR
jgi:hypothetical protein